MPLSVNVANVYMALSLQATQFRRGMAQASGSVLGLSRAFERFRASMVASAVATAAYAAGIGAIFAAFRGSDAIINFENRIAESVSVLQGFNVTAGQTRKVFQELSDIARETRSGLEGTVTIFTRVAQSGESLEFGLDTILQFTKSLNQAVALGGSTAAESQNALIQLSQGLASGTLRGDELRSVLEQLPVVADVIAKRLGVTRGALRELGKDGRISARDIIIAFREAEQDLDRRFTNLNLTLASALQVLRNSTTEIFGTFAKDSGVVEVLARLVLGLADNLERLARVVVTVVAGFIALGSARVLGGVIKLFATLATLLVTTKLGAVVVGFGVAVSFLGKVLAGTAGYFVAFGEQITVFSGGLATAHDLMGFLYDEFVKGNRVVQSFVDVFENAGPIFNGVLGELIFRLANVTAFVDFSASYIQRRWATTSRNVAIITDAFGVALVQWRKNLDPILGAIVEFFEKAVEPIQPAIDALIEHLRPPPGESLADYMDRHTEAAFRLQAALENYARSQRRANGVVAEAINGADRILFTFDQLQKYVSQGIDFSSIFTAVDDASSRRFLAGLNDVLTHTFDDALPAAINLQDELDKTFGPEAQNKVKTLEQFFTEAFTAARLKATEAMRTARDEINKLADVIEGVAVRALGTFEKTLVNVFKTGRFEAKQLLDAIAIDLVTQLVRTTITSQIAVALDSLFTGLFSGLAASATGPSAALVAGATAAAAALQTGAIVSQGELVLGGVLAGQAMIGAAQSAATILAGAGGIGLVAGVAHEGALAGFFRKFRLLSGGLRGDEVGAILQKGEGIIPRDIMRRRDPFEITQFIRSLPRFHTGGIAGQSRMQVAGDGGAAGSIEIINRGTRKDIVDARARVTPKGVVTQVIMEDVRTGGQISQAIKQIR